MPTFTELGYKELSAAAAAFGLVVPIATPKPIQDKIGDAYRAADFSVTPNCRWALDVLIEEGFVFDSSIDPARHDRSGVLATRCGNSSRR